MPCQKVIDKTRTLYYIFYDRVYSCRKKLYKIYLDALKINSRKIVFDNFFGKEFADTPKYIVEEILRQGKDWDLVWLTNKRDIQLPQGIRPVLYGSRKAYREIASAKIFVDNIRNSKRPEKKAGQIYLQTWHGGLGFKSVELAAESKLSPEYIRMAKLDGENCDAIISSCEFVSKEYRKFFWLNKNTEILQHGLPRNDALFNTQHVQEKKYVIYQQYGIPKETKVILYMPTFRDDFSLDGYKLDFYAILSEMEQKFGDKFVFFVRLHPNVQNQTDFVTYDERIVNCTTFPDAQELYMAADYMITDYSSAAFDFLLMQRPVFLCLLDHEQYCKERGLNEVFDLCPIPKAYSNEDLLNAIRCFDSADYWEKVNSFKMIWKPFDDGHAAEKIVDWMEKKMQER